ncbi:MAG: enoyl-CoA hydratase [Aquabacterium sp.]|nr:enoyl-CoA hydratase [Aquabacterium sp.]MBP6614400.1 enoyl-CoA hydratase [Aquabacterium sp.]MBP7501652.1 enoyl-CoA hydratase [Aquabacterium sp.]
MSEILQHREAGVLTLTFNRLDKKNAITTAMYTRLAEELEAATADDSVRVAVIQGAVEIFTAGNDLADFLNNPPVSKPGAEVPPVVRFLNAIRDFPKPIVAAVAGPAVGIGTTLLLHCDLVYAGDNAAFSLPFVNLGLCPEAGASLLLPQIVGYPKAAEKLMLGEAFYAEEALEMGLINRIVPPHEVNAYAQSQAAKLAAKPAASLRVTKSLMKMAQTQLAPVMTEELKHFGALLQGPAAKEAISAVMEKRKPDFSKC